MKLKYYLRGLGMGMFVTALILIIAHNVNDGISDAEIIRRAKALGMVMSTEDNLFNDETSTADKNNETTTSENQSTEEPTTEEPTTEEPTTEEPTTEESTTEESTTEESTTEEPTTEEPTTVAPMVKELTFTVERGMYSEAVTRILVQGGIITNEAEFNQYLSDTGYDEKIQTGIFTVNSGMSYEEIAKILSKKR